MIKSPLKNKKDIVFVEDSLIGNESQLKLILMKFKSINWLNSVLPL
jgi:hypothetical protein